MRYWRKELNRLLLLAAAALGVGLLAGNITLILLLALAGYTLLNLIQLRRLQRWLERRSAAERPAPPEAFGLWGGVFDGIHSLEKRERESRRFLTNIINKAQKSSAALQWGIIMIDRHNNLDWWNQAGERLLGLRHPQDRNQSVTNLIRDPRFADYFHKGDYEEPLQLGEPGGGSRMLEFQIAVFGEQERLIIVRDITRLHRLEQMRKDFVGNISHELGTPVTVIKGYLESIRDDRKGLGRKWRGPVEQMWQQSQRMENLVRDLVLLSQLETGAPPPRQDEFALSEIFAEVRHDIERVFADKKHRIQVDCDESLRLRGERGEIHSAVSNLAANAAKYTPAGGKITLRAEGGEPLRIVVEDNGIGIDSRHLPRLTERFYRVDESRSLETGGTGLGLAIVKHVLSRHQGRLLIESEPGKGSRFIAELPGG